MSPQWKSCNLINPFQCYEDAMTIIEKEAGEVNAVMDRLLRYLAKYHEKTGGYGKSK